VRCAGDDHVEPALVQVSRLRQGAATAADLNAIVPGNAVGGRGFFVAALQEGPGRRGLEIRAEAHDLIAELEDRKVVSAFEKLASIRHDGSA
jgi:hypothetical protein